MAENMETLGEDIVLLALAPNGRLIVWDRLRFALAGSELVRLVASGRIDLVDGPITVAGTAEPDPADPLLANALDSIRRAGAPPRVDAWVSGRGQGTVDAYLASLDAAGVIRAERRRILGLTLFTRWYMVDAERLRQARARLDEVAQESRIDEDREARCSPEQATLGGLVAAIGLGAELYPGPEGAAARERLVAVGRADGMPGVAARVAGDAALRAIREAVDVAMHITIDASIEAAHAATAQDAAHAGTVTGGHYLFADFTLSAEASNHFGIKVFAAMIEEAHHTPGARRGPRNLDRHLYWPRPRAAVAALLICLSVGLTACSQASTKPTATSTNPPSLPPARPRHPPAGRFNRSPRRGPCTPIRRTRRSRR